MRQGRYPGSLAIERPKTVRPFRGFNTVSSQHSAGGKGQKESQMSAHRKKASSLRITSITGASRYPNTGEASESTSRERPLSPPSDILTFVSHIEIRIALPGVPKEAVTVEADGRRIAVSGDRKQPPDTKGLTPLWTEQRFGPFLRAFVMESPVDPSTISARMDRGILTIVIPRPAMAPLKRIPVS